MKTIKRLMTATLLLIISMEGFGQSAGPDQTTCQYNTATMAASGAGIWTAYTSNPTSAIITNSNNPATTISGLSAPGIYGFIWTVGAAADTVLLTVNSRPDAGPDKTTSVGSYAIMNATGPGTWVAGAGNPGTANIVTPTSAMTTISGFSAIGSYYFIWSNGGGCTDTAMVNVTTTGSAGPDQTICYWNSAHMAATGSGSWLALAGNPSSTYIAQPTLATTTISNLTATGIYRFAWVTGPVRDTVALTVVLRPTISISSLDHACSGMMDSFYVTINNAGANPSFQWSIQGINVGTNSPALNTLMPYTPDITFDTVAITITSNVCDAGIFTSYISVEVDPVPPAPTLSLAGGCMGSDSIIVSGLDGPLALRWSLAGAVVDSTSYQPYTAAGGNSFGTGANQLTGPQQVFIDAAGNLYVADAGNYRIQKFPPGSTSLTNGVTVAGGNSWGTATNQITPFSLFVDAAGYLYVGDYSNNRVLKFPPGSTSATSGVIVAGGNGTGSAPNQIYAPQGIYVDTAGNLYVADEGNQRILKFPAGSTSATNGIIVAGGNGQGSAANQFYGPSGVFVDRAGYLYVSDYRNGRVMKFPPNSTSATNGILVAQGYSANQLYYPMQVYVDTNGYTYVVNDRASMVQRFAPGNTVGVTVAGGSQGSGPNQFNFVTGVYLDAAGNLYASDKMNYRVQKWPSNAIHSASYIPPSAGSYAATYVTANGGCTSPPSNTITIAHCLADSVWPGDADHNGVADNNDLLPIGIGYGLNGFTRPDQSIVWSAHYAQDWGVQFLSGTNTKHADCNGDGMIDANDTTAIMLNFGLTHSKTNGITPWRSGIPGISLKYSKDTVQAGDTLVVSLILGDSITPASGIYGLAFTYHYDPLVVDTTSCIFGFTNSFLGNSTDKISLHKDFKGDGTFKAAVTGINHTNRSGYGEIARFIAAITTNNINGKDLAYYSNVNYISDIYAVDKDGRNISLNAGIDSNQVAYEPNGIKDGSLTRILIYPNPTQDAFTIQGESSIVGMGYTLSDITGRMLLADRILATGTHISISSLSPGVYMLNLAGQTQSYRIIKK